MTSFEMYGSFVELRSDAEAELFCSAACAEQTGAALEGAVRRGVWGALWKDKVRYCAAVRRGKVRYGRCIAARRY